MPAGGLIGRLPTAALRIDHPRVSEAHALVSLRAGALWMLALRGALEVDGATVSELRLARGQVIRLAEDVTIQVEAVELPEHILVMVLPAASGSAEGLRFPLQGEVVSVVEGDPLRAVARFVEPAVARLWPTGPGWRLQVAGERAREVAEGLELPIAGHTVYFQAIVPSALADPATDRRGRLHAPMHLVVTWSDVTVRREGRPPAHLSGLDARIIGELVDFPEPVGWLLVAQALWKGETHPTRLRQNWDKALARLRQHLALSGIREDLVRTDGHGNVCLYLVPGDTMDREAV